MHPCVYDEKDEYDKTYYQQQDRPAVRLPQGMEVFRDLLKIHFARNLHHDHLKRNGFGVESWLKLQATE
jgi:hypothetical protein